MIKYLPVFACCLLLAACSDPNNKRSVPDYESAPVSASEPSVVRSPEVLDLLLQEYEAEIAWELGEGPDPGTSREDFKRIRAEIDHVSGQVDGWVSGLYWHKSIDDATQVAAATGKPVLMLRLLGNLDDEFC
jgi:hypothetical protein